MKRLAFALLLLVIFPISALEESFSPPVQESIQSRLDHAYKIRSKNPQLFRRHIDGLNDIRSKLTPEQVVKLDYLNAYLAAFTGNINRALALCEQLIESKDAEYADKFKARLLLINIAAVSKDWASGLKQVTPTIAELPNVQNPDLYNKALGVLSIFLNVLGQYEQSLHYANMHRETTFGTREHCTIYSSIVEASLRLNKPELSLAQNTLKSCEAANESIVKSSVHVFIARYFLANEQYQNALSELLPLTQKPKYLAYPRFTFDIYVTIAEAYWELGQIGPAHFYANKAIDYIADLETSEPTVRAYHILYKIAKNQGKHLLALNYHEKYVAADKAFLDEVSSKTAAYELSKQDVLQKEAELKILNKQNELLKAEQKAAEAETANTQLIIALLLIAILVMFYIGLQVAKKQKRLRELAEYDPLTGIYNRGHFTQATQSAINYCELTEQSLSLILFDLDDFKKVNDRFGHATGDWALTASANAIKAIGRKNDIFARIGGEEFCIVLIGCHVHEAAEIAEHCRQALEAVDTRESGFDFRITGSFGVTDVMRSGMVLEKLLGDADSAAYRSKHAGRNRVTLFGDEPYGPRNQAEKVD